MKRDIIPAAVDFYLSGKAARMRYVKWIRSVLDHQQAGKIDPACREQFIIELVDILACTHETADAYVSVVLEVAGGMVEENEEPFSTLSAFPHFSLAEHR